MTLGCSVMADWFGWIAGILGLVGALLLARPLFLLLDKREALETLVYAKSTKKLPADLARKAVRARQAISASVFAARSSWKSWAIPGVVLLFAAFIPLVLQAACLL